MPSIPMDYSLMRDENEGSVTVITLREKRTKAYCAHVVKSKGTENDIAETIVNDVETIGVVGKLIRLIRRTQFKQWHKK